MTASHGRALGQTREQDTEGRLGNLPKVHEPPGVGGDLEAINRPALPFWGRQRTEEAAERSARG